MLDTVGGLSGGLGGSGGVGGSIPSNSSAANSAATSTINPSVTLAGGVGGGYQEIGPLSINFPQTQGADSINAPAAATSIIPKSAIYILLGGLGLIVAYIAILKR